LKNQIEDIVTKAVSNVVGKTNNTRATNDERTKELIILERERADMARLQAESDKKQALIASAARERAGKESADALIHAERKRANEATEATEKVILLARQGADRVD
jgi:hypothetical protein